MARIVFYSPVQNITLFSRVGFYATDIRILKELGHEVITTNSLKTIINEEYDTLFAYFYTWSVFAVLISRFKGKLAILTGGADMLDSGYNKSITKLLLHQSMFRLGYIFCSKILAVSTSDYKNIVKLVGDKKVLLVPHVVDTDYFTPSSSKQPNTFLTIGWMGTEENVRRKGMDSAVKLLAELRDRGWNAKLIIAGTGGPGAEYLNKLAFELNVVVNVEFRFNVTEDDKLNLLQSNRYYLQLSEFEGFGLAALEALSCGACVVHTGRGGLNDFLNDYGLRQAWPIKIKDIADDIICNNLLINTRDSILKRHMHVVENYSFKERREIIETIITI
jgi:glycosyltransferase involved in cell wall biosynthesis